MSVSLVKVYFTAGWAMPGCLPESDPTLFTSLDDAREYIASELDRAAEQAGSIGEDDTDWDAASLAGSAEIVRNDRDGDVTWQAMRGEWSSHEPDGYVYFIGRI
jgi:hypothetical protein